MRKVLLSVVAISLFSFGCQKSSERILSNENSQSSIHQLISAEVDCTPDNPGNSHDMAGLEHNRRLVGILNSPDLYGSSYSDIAYAAQQWCIKNGVTPDEEASSIEVMETIVNDYPNSFENVIDQTSLSTKAKEYLSYLTNVEEDTDYCLFKEILVDKEEEIMSSLLNENEKEILLQTYSIARYSAFYQLSINVESSTLAITSWLTRALFDAMGFIIGYEFGQINGLPLEDCRDRAYTRAAEASACSCL